MLVNNISYVSHELAAGLPVNTSTPALLYTFFDLTEITLNVVPIQKKKKICLLTLLLRTALLKV